MDIPKKPFLSIKNLTKEYTSKKVTPVKALNGVSLEIHQGEIFSLLGVNGAGKTTLSSILATLHPPTSGTICFKGVSIYDDLMNYRRSIGFCPQKANLDTALNVRENLVFAGRYFLLPEDTVQQRADKLLEEFEISHYARFKVNVLSGGNQQRLLIARALMHKPEIVILDEPTVGMDPDIRHKLWKLILSLKSMGVTIILTTHYLDEAEYLSDRICILNKGRIQLLASLKGLKEKYKMHNLEEFFLQFTHDSLNKEASDAETIE